MAATPVQAVNASVIAKAKFGSCPETSASIGSASRDIAMVTTNQNPYKAMQGETENIIITSSTFTGSWYNDTIAGSVVATTPTYSIVPANVDTLYYSVSAEFGGVGYGRVPVWIYIYPSLEFTVADPELCSGDSIDLKSTVSGYQDSVYFRYYTDRQLTNELTGDDLKVGPIVTTEYYVQAHNSGGFLSDTVLVTVSLLPELRPDESLSVISTSGKSVFVDVAVINSGNMPIGPPVPVTLYKDEVSAGNVIATGQLPGQLAANDTVYVTITVSDITVYNPLHIIVRVNDDGLTYPFQAECDTTNNRMKILNPSLGLLMEKEATLNNVTQNGTDANPVSVLYGENIEYRITAVNANISAGPVIVRDTLPAYLKYVGGSGSTGVLLASTGGMPGRDILTWTISGVSPMTQAIVTYEATPIEGVCASQPLFMNQAWITSSDTIHISTNKTYHQGAGVSVVTFSAEKGGSVYYGEQQVLDYKTTPKEGVLAVADEGYLFTGWSHQAYTSLRGERIGALEGVMCYDTLTIYGNVQLMAHFEVEEYSIKYYLNGSVVEANPETYTIESSDIRLEAPSKPGDTFVGWTGSNGEELQMDVSILAGTTGDRIYYAHFLYSGSESVPPNEDIHRTEDEEKVWSNSGKLYVKIGGGKESVVRIYTLSGILFDQRRVPAGSIVEIPLERGFYFVTINDRAGRTVRIE